MEEGKKPFWDYSTGAKVEGRFLRFIETKFGVAMELDNVLIDCNVAQIKMAVSAIASKISRGDKISVEWKGKSPEGAWHLYDVYYNGNLVERPKGFRKAPKAVIEDFFGIEEEEKKEEKAGS